MRKTVEILALSSLLFVFVCSVVFPQSPFMWLATVSYNFTMLRIILITLLGTLLITSTVFDHQLRVPIGFFAFCLSVWALASTYDNHLQILDTLSFLAAGAALGIEALEPGIDSVPAEPMTVKHFGTDMKHRLTVYTLAVYSVSRLLALTHPHPFGHRTGHGHRTRAA